MEKGALEDKKLYEEFSNIIQRFNINKIIETGTYLGWSTKIICTFGLPVESVEVNSEFYIHAKKNLVNENLKLHNSNSIDFLNSMKIKKNENYLFFIDSHWGPEPLPLLEELDAISKKGIKPVIIIHDFFVPDEFGNAKFGYDQYGDQKLCIDFIEPKLKKIYGSYEFHYNKEIDCVNSGVIFIYPKQTEDDSTSN